MPVKASIFSKITKMSKLKLRGKDLRAIGYPEGPVISIAMNIMEKNYKHEKE
jgi:tRNA-splicing ligase RtcB